MSLPPTLPPSSTSPSPYFAADGQVAGHPDAPTGSPPVPLVNPGAPNEKPANQTNPESADAPGSLDSSPDSNLSGTTPTPILKDHVSKDRIPTSATPKLHADDRRNIWGVPFHRLTMEQTIGRIEEMIRTRVPGYAVTANLNFLMLCEQHPELAPVVRDADLIVADGQPIVWRSRLGGMPLPERVAGSEMIYRLAQEAASKGWRLYFLGGEPGVAQKCADTLALHYPNLQIAGVESPPFRPLSEEEQRQQTRRIQDSGADVLLVAFGQPKGEIWIHQRYQQLGVPVSIQLGASFDFVAGTAQRAPRAFQRFGLEWFHRMMSDPRRLVPRYFGNACFLARAIARDWHRQVVDWGMWDSRSSKNS